MKIILTGGGTAGHVNPALAIGELFRQNMPRCEITFVGTPDGMERRLAKEAGYPYVPIEASGFRRTLSLHDAKALILAITSPRKAKRFLREYAPDIVIGTGGYVCWPMLSAAASLGIPTAIHESNAIPGLTVRRLAARVDLVLLNFEEAANHLPHFKKIVRVGNPLRSGFSRIDRAEARMRLGIPKEIRLAVSFGGSLGAEAINHAMLSYFSERVPSETERFYIHGTGTRYFGDFKRKIEETIGTIHSHLHYSAYLTEMPLLMAAADLLICRAGAMTISEAARARRATILIPSPHVAEDHQTKNAEALAAAGAAILIKENELSPQRLRDAIDSILDDAKKQERMEDAISRFDLPNANKKTYEALRALI